MITIGVLLPLYTYAYDVCINGIYYNLHTNNKTAEVAEESYSGEVVIPSVITANAITYNVTSIGDYAFYNCSDLTSVAISNSVTSIGFNAFSGCSSLASVNIPNSVTFIDDNAFNNCSGLTSVTIPNSVTIIGRGAFNNTPWFNNQANGLIYINNVAYCYKGTMPSNTSITIQEGTVSISPSAFSGCSGLASVTIPNSVTTIGTGAFQFCTGLTSVDIPNSVTSIGLHAFSYSTGLTSVTIPNSVTSIGNYAFSGCRKLASVVSDIKEPCVFGNNAFSSIASNCTLTVPYGTKDAYIAKGWTESVFKGGIIEAPSPNITFADANVKSLCVANWDTNGDGELSEDEAAAVTNLGTVFKGNADIVAFDELQYFTGLTSIGDYAFRQCFNLRNIIIPNGVTSIGNSAFDECQNMESVIIPNSVVSIGNSAFWYCNYKLKSVAIPNSVKSIGSYAFEYCSALTSVTMGNSVTSIGYAAFRYSGLHSINIPSSVKQIESAAFEKCNGLTSIVSEMQSPSVRLDANSTIFSFSAVCKLTVPYGTKETYIAKGWTEGVFRGGIVEAEPDPSLLNTLAVTNAEVCKGRQITFPVNMSNTKSITALQFEMTLPAGVSIAKNAQGKYIVEKTGRCADHTLNVSKPGDANVYKVLLYITPVENITGSEGAVLNVTLETSESMTEGDYEVTISNINLTTPEETKITPADVTCKLTVNNSIPGDANGDGSIDVTDIVSIANAILGRPSSSFDAAAADVNGDGSIDVTDIVVIANMILRGNGQNNAKMRGGDEDDEEDMLDPQ